MQKAVWSILLFKQISEGRIREEKLTIDLYVWLNEWKGRRRIGA